jgi:hypothetical protein
VRFDIESVRLDTLIGITEEQPGSENSENQPSRDRRLGRWGKAGIALAVLVVAAFAVLASQQGGDSGGSGPLNAIAQAAEKTQSEPGGRAAMRTIVTEPGSEPIAMRGQFVFDGEGRSRAVLTAQGHGSDGPFRMKMVTDGTVMYMSSSKFGTLPDGNKWMAIDLTLGRELDSPVPTTPDAKGELELLESVTGDVQKLGREVVRGVPTTRYRGAIGVAEQAEKLREVGADNLAGRSEEESSPLRVEAWIDADGLVRRMRLLHTEPQIEGAGTKTMDMHVDFFDFGIEPQIEVPDSDEVFDATELAEEELSKH